MLELDQFEMEKVSGGLWKEIGIFLLDNMDSLAEGFKAGAHTENVVYGDGLSGPNA